MVGPDRRFSNLLDGSSSTLFDTDRLALERAIDSLICENDNDLRIVRVKRYSKI